ncbi:DUF1549 domain-containing protein [bacterium]|nr:DUF1549 domain-containing protein [bacterium]
MKEPGVRFPASNSRGTEQAGAGSAFITLIPGVLHRSAEDSREAVTARSCGRQPAVDSPTIARAAKRRQRPRLAAAASRLCALLATRIRGLTPTATCCRRFAALIAFLLTLASPFFASAPCSLAEDESSTDEAPIMDVDRDHWAFRPLVRPEVPQAAALSDWPRNSIDEFILERLVKADLEPAPEADRVTLIRRLYFDLTGLPPSPQDVDRFVADKSPDAYERLVERLLAAPEYGERWAQHWLDLARFAETDGFEHDKVREEAWKYRDWVINALNEDLPFDEFTRRQLAGDEITSEFRVATGFLTCGPDMPDINLQDERRHSFLNDMTATVGSVFLGLQIGCAQCHDHKYDPISQRDFYRLRAFFDPAFAELSRNKPVALPDSNNPSTSSFLMIRGDFRRQGPALQPAFLRIANPEKSRPMINEARSNLRTELADWLTRPNQPLVTRMLANRLWHYHFGRGLSETPSDVGVVGDSPLYEDLLNWLATEIPRRRWSLKEMHRLIVTSATWRQSSHLPGDATSAQRIEWLRTVTGDPGNLYFSRGTPRRLEGEAIRDTMLTISGQLSQRRGGPGIRPPLPPELVQTLLKNQWPVSEDPADYTRRSIYLFVRRNLRYPLFEAFDKPDTNVSCPRRNLSTIAPQALMLLNSEASLQAAEMLASQIRDSVGDSARKQVEAAWRRILCRPPTADEMARAVQFLATESNDLPRVDTSKATPLVDLCLALLNTNEFLYVD